MAASALVKAELAGELKRVTRAHNLSLLLSLELKDEEENTVYRRNIEARSFLLNFINMLMAWLTASSRPGKDVNGNTVDLRLSWDQRTVSFLVEGRTIGYTITVAGEQAWALKEDDTHGILVGTGNKPVEFTDYRLENKIPNGLGPGKMLYLSCDVGPTTVAADMAFINIARGFINNSGSDITVREVGLAVHQISPDADILIIRDLIGETVVPNGYLLQVTYTLLARV